MLGSINLINEYNNNKRDNNWLSVQAPLFPALSPWARTFLVHVSFRFFFTENW